VSTGGLSKDALYEAERASGTITLVNLPKLRQILVDFYEKLDPQTRALVPFEQLYWPIVNIG
jgi:restriction system protein